MSYPIIPRGSIERDIAKQLHNMVWKQNESEWNANERELKQLRDKRDKDGISNKEENRIGDLKKQQEDKRKAIESEIDAKTREEIEQYRAASNESGGCEAINALVERIDELESQLGEIRDAADDAQCEAEEAQGNIDDLESKIEELESRIDEMESIKEELESRIEELESRIEELE